MDTNKDKKGVLAEEDEFKGMGDGLFGEGLGGEKEDEDEDSRVRNSSKSADKVSKHQKIVKAILRRSKKNGLPPLKHLLRGKWGNDVAIKDISLFIGDQQDDEIMAEIAKKCPIRNRVNLSAEIDRKHMLDVGAQIVAADKMHAPIQVAKITEDGRLECTSGRHRLAFFALVYGANVKIPVYMEKMTLNEARDAVVVANQSRATKALERAEHTVLRAVQGDVLAAQDDLYHRTITSKPKAKQYCIFSVVSRSYPAKLAFRVSTGSTRTGGCLTTLANIGGFWSAALEWIEGMERKEFDSRLKTTVMFLNSLVAEMQKLKDFNPKEHLATKQLVAIGKYYRSYSEITGGDAVSMAGKIAKAIVGMGPIGGEKSEKTYAALTKELALKK